MVNSNLKSDFGHELWIEIQILERIKKLDETKDSISKKTDALNSRFTSDLSTTHDQITATNSKLIRLDEQLEAIDEKVQTGLLTRNVSDKKNHFQSPGDVH